MWENQLKKVRFALILSLIAVGCTVERAPLEVESIEAGAELRWPEMSRESEPWARWWWMGSTVEEAALSELIAAYDSAGLGGLEITPIYGVRGYEDQTVDYLSPRWMDLLAHTTETAGRHGMGIDMATGTGWPFGGPHIPPEHAAARVIVDTFALGAGEPFGASLVRRAERAEREAVLQALMAYGPEGRILDLTDRVDGAGRLDWTAPPGGTWMLYAVYQGWTGQQVKRAAPGGQGRVIDHYSEEALSYYLARFDSAFAGYEGGPVRAFFNDSFEVYGSNWTDDFFEEFAARRGYDLRRHLPAYVGEGPEEAVARVRSDFRETISELLLEEFTRPWRDWAHARGSLVRNQSHGSPGNLIDLYAAVDIPETETFHPSAFPIPGLRTHPDYLENPGKPNPLVFKFASSAAHLTGKRLTSSESATWLDEHFRVSLAQVKPEIDQLFASGINHVFYHGIPYSPPEEDWPGWLFYASVHFGPTNTFWRDLPALNRYIARTQSFLQSGRPDHDVLLYFPIHDLWQRPDDVPFQLTVHNPDEWLYGTPVGDAAAGMQARGYTFDYVSDRLLGEMDAEEGGLQAPGGRYRAVVVPKTQYMPLETLEQLLHLAEEGGTVAFQGGLPEDVPGLGDLENRRARLRELRASLAWAGTGDPSVRQARRGAGRVLVGEDLEALLRAAGGLRREPMADRGLLFARRSHSRGHHYFVTNLGAEPVEGWVPLGVTAQSAVLFDPMREQQGVAALQQGAGGAPEVYLQLEPGASLLVRTFADEEIEGTPWPYLEEYAAAAVPVEGTWQVDFVAGGPERPPSFTTERLGSWTEQGGEAARAFSGTARYTVTFEKPDREAEEWVLDLGRVGESARVWLNGEEVGRVWSHPFTIRVGPYLREGENRLEVEVTNLMANRIADLDRRSVPWKKFHDANIVGIDYRPFDASAWDPMPSGLLGPVRLIPADLVAPST